MNMTETVVVVPQTDGPNNVQMTISMNLQNVTAQPTTNNFHIQAASNSTNNNGSNVIYQTVPQNLQSPQNIQQVIMVNDEPPITCCTAGCGCCAMATMITFLGIFFVELIFVWAFKDNAQDYDIDLYSAGPDDIGHFIDFMLIMYSVEIGITIIFLFIFFYFKLWIKWYQTQQNFCFMILVLFLIWFIAAIITSVAYESEFDTDLSFGKVLSLIILFTICGPFCILCQGW